MSDREQVADWSEAPSVLEGATNLELTPRDCNLDYWIGAVTQGTWKGLVNGHPPETSVPDYMLEDGPLRSAVVEELAFRSMSEESATRFISYLVLTAPDIDTMEFFSSQLLDEARHARVFRGHLVELGVPEDELFETMERVAGSDRDRILGPLAEFSLPLMQELDNFIEGVAFVTVLVEGMLAPFAELSERKWRPLDPAAADIERGANIDEVRHLTVGSEVVRKHLIDYPDTQPQVLDFITRAREVWASVPIPEVIYRREVLYQEGLEQHADLVGDYELEPGRRLLDTTAEERLMLALKWTNEMQESRLVKMGLEEAIPPPVEAGA